MYSHDFALDPLAFSSEKKCFIEKFQTSTSQFAICKITIQLCASFKMSICSQRADVPEEREAKFMQVLPKHPCLRFLETQDKVFCLQVEEKTEVF